MYNKILTLILISLLLTGCYVTRDGEIYINSLPRDYTKTLLVDTTSADSLQSEKNIAKDSSYTSAEFELFLNEMRRQEFRYPKQGGGNYVIKYHEGDVIYAAIISSKSVTQEDIVFYEKKWYYNKGSTKMISSKQATAFVNAILEAVAVQENPELQKEN